jgi:hypothetical protein
MLIKNWIITGIAVAAMLAYIVGIPPSFSAEYSKTTQSIRSENNCGNTDAVDSGQPPSEQPPSEQPPSEQPPSEQPPSEQPPSEQPPSDYESLMDNTDNSQSLMDNTDNSQSLMDNTDNTQKSVDSDNTPTYCSNFNSQVQGEDNTALLATVRR